jgi:hypothetical protein
MTGMNPFKRAVRILVRWQVDSSIDRRRPLPNWVRSRMHRDWNLASYVQGAREADRQLRRSAAKFRGDARVASTPKPWAGSARIHWIPRLAAAAALALLVAGGAVVLTRSHRPATGPSPHVDPLIAHREQVVDSTNFEMRTPARLNELLDRTRIALDSEQLPLVIEARRLAQDGRELGRHLLEQLPVRPVAFIRRHELDGEPPESSGSVGDQRSGA